MGLHIQHDIQHKAESQPAQDPQKFIHQQPQQTHWHILLII